MDDVASVKNENANFRKIQVKLLQWEAKDCPLAQLTSKQQDALDFLTQIMNEENSEVEVSNFQEANTQVSGENEEKSLDKLCLLKDCIDKTHDFLAWFDKVSDEIYVESDDLYLRYLQELEARSNECSRILEEISEALGKLSELKLEYDFVSNKTSSLNTASEKLIQEQTQLSKLSEEIQSRLHYFKLADQLLERLQSPTLSVASDSFKDCLNKVDECLDYLKRNLTYKDSTLYIVKYRQCLSWAIVLMRNYVTNVMFQAREQILSPRNSVEKSNPDTAFALYYGKFHSCAIKVKRISSLIEERIGENNEYEQLLQELHHCYLSERAKVMSPAVDKSIKDLRSNNKGDHCSLVRSTCAFLVHVCQDEHRLFYQFFSMPSDQLNSYLEGLCTILYDSLRPQIIHINHLETLAEICSILRTEMLDEHVNQNPDSLEAFGKTVFSLLQDVQERLVFRAHLYLQTDILNFNPSPGDLAYPEKLEMMESIALSLQEHPLRRSESRISMASSVSSAIPESEIGETMKVRYATNSPADLHGMWYPTVRRTLVCLSRLYRCIDRPIFQGLSQEALKYCIQSVSSAAAKIAASKTPIDGELFEIKHLLILREQIAPFRVDFTIKETSLDFSKVKTAAFGLLQKRKQLFSLGSNNALLEFLLEGTPQVRENFLDSRKDVDRQLKTICEKFIKDSVFMLVGPIVEFLDKAQNLLSDNKVPETKGSIPKVNYILRQSPWASPQQISGCIQESQRFIKNKLSGLQRAMQLYLSNRDTEFIIFRPIRNNIISTIVKLEQLLTTHGYSSDDMIITGCPSAEQISILLSSASILADSATKSSNLAVRKTSSESIPSARKVSEDKKVSFDESVSENKADNGVV